jgi:alkanesulfonate monooxygenase SsuD/methylene tetrahydromethanopterin reductase-like flavin-dependent oxidoreductase (luciferase family)
MESIQFGWRVPDFPEYSSEPAAQRAITFRKDIFHFMDALHGRMDTAWVGDHFFPWPGEVDQTMETHEAWTILTYLLAHYPSIRMGTIVLSQSYRPPAALAKMAAVLQWLSQGRLILGIGAGWKENEYRAYGYEYPADRVRLDQLEEAVQIIRKMWTEESPSFEGKHYQIQDAYCAPRPDPIPPLLIGGAGPKRTLRIVAKYGDWCNLNNSDLDFCRSRLDTLREHCSAVGRDYDSIVKTYSCDCVAIAPTHQQAEEIYRSSFYAPYAPMTGTPDEVAARIQPFVDLGFSHFILRFADFPSTAGLELFLQEVMPRFQLHESL